MWDWLFDLVDPLEKAGIPYAIVGSVASSVYGEPRVTNDVDVIIQIARSDAQKLFDAFPAERFYVPPPEVIEIETSRTHGAHINVIDQESMAKADLYPLDARQAEWFADRRRLEIAGRPLWFARPEAVIVAKLRFYREGGSEKHLRDIRSMLAVSGEQIDRAMIERAVAELGLGEQWRRVTED